MAFQKNFPKKSIMINQEVGRLSRWISAITVVGLSLLGVNNDAIGQTGNIFLNSTGTGSASVLDPGNDDYITNSGRYVFIIYIR